MEYTAEAKYIHISPRKLREVVAAVGGQQLDRLLVTLEFMNKRAAKILLKALRAAVANVQVSNSQARNSLRLSKIEINEGPALKRWRPVSRGRAHPYKRRMSHIKIVLADQ